MDHIDDDKTKDILSNLQILTQKQNNLKEGVRRRVLVEIKCPNCGEIFIKRSGLTQVIDCNKGKITCCSKICSDLFKKLKKSIIERDIISKNSVIRVFKKNTISI